MRAEEPPRCCVHSFNDELRPELAAKDLPKSLDALVFKTLFKKSANQSVYLHD